MNRIYQGRVVSVEVNEGSLKEPAWVPLQRAQWEARLWNHHVIFQDAVNYYLVALAALADRAHASTRLIQDLQVRIEAAWEAFPRATRSPAKGLRESISPWLRLPEAATPQDAYDAILNGNEVEPEVRVLALALLLEKCGGESAIQQGGRGYLPRFCDPHANPTWDFSSAALMAISGKNRLAEILHAEQPAQSALEQIALEMDLSWTVKVQPGKFYTADESVERLKEALYHVRRLLASGESRRVKEAVAAFPDFETALTNFAAKLSELSGNTEIPRNRKASKDLTFATLVFQYFPCALTARVLSLFVKKPTASSAEKSAPRVDFSAFGDDPIKLARGSRGYVFPAFTALPDWNPRSAGEPVWKEFDIAAFKEALKSLNQFNQKTSERVETENDLRGRLAILLGSRIPGWKPRKTDTGEELSEPKALNSDLFALACELERTLTENIGDTLVGEFQIESFGGTQYTWREGEWQITRAGLRGFRHIRDEWIKVRVEYQGSPPQSALEEVVKRYQADEKHSRSIGSVPLFLHLCEERFWPLWLGDEDVGESEGHRSFLHEMVSFHLCFRDFRRSLEPINLTPAEPVFSRRLYMFSDIKDQLAKVVYGNGSETNTVQCALAQRGSSREVSETRVRLCYSAKRLLRDELQGGEQSRWLQPMTRALGLPEPESREPAVFASALSLMPDLMAMKSGKGFQRRFLLNFPVTLDPEWIRSGLGKADRWQGQFNGTGDKNLHLHWPETINKKVKGGDSPWWLNTAIIEKGFTTLSVDLGQRTAAAFALLRVTCRDPREGSTPTKRPVREIGFDGTRYWFAEVLTTGMLRLPGEGVESPDGYGGKRSKKFDAKGRPTSLAEWKEACRLAKALDSDTPENWVGHSPEEKRLPEQNDALIALAARRLSRLNTFHRWSCFDPDRLEIAARREALVKKLTEELSHWKDPDVVEWKRHADAGNFKAFRKAAGEGFSRLRDSLGEQLVTLANRTVPLRDRSWEWIEQENRGNPSSTCRQLVDTGPALGERKTWIRGQRGLL